MGNAKLFRWIVAALGSLSLGIAVVWPHHVAVTATSEETIAPNAVWPADYIVARGDRVVGIGQLVQPGGDSLRLCTGLDAIISAVYHCTSLSVAVDGLDIGWLDGVRRSDGAAYVDAVIRGWWDGETLKVDRVGGAALRMPAPPILSCQFEVPGAIEEAHAGQWEAPYRHLQSIIDGDTAAYAGSWLSTSGDRKVLVATTRDLASTAKALRVNFPFRLCLVRVPYSTADLEAILDGLQLPAGIPWRPEIDVQRNRVLVRLPILDAQAVQALMNEPGVDVVPLVFKDRSAP